MLTPGPSAWPRRLLNQPARHPACLDCLARSTTGTFRSAALLLFWKHDRQSRPAIATASASSSKHHSRRISSASHRHDCGCDPRLSRGVIRGHLRCQLGSRAFWASWLLRRSLFSEGDKEKPFCIRQLDFAVYRRYFFFLARSIDRPSWPSKHHYDHPLGAYSSNSATTTTCLRRPIPMELDLHIELCMFRTLVYLCFLSPSLTSSF